MFEASHPDENVLELYCMEKLAGSALDDVEDHLMLCSHCQDLVTECDTFLHSMRIALAQPQLEEAPARFDVMKYFRMPAFGWVPAGAAALALMGTVFTRNFTPTTAPIALSLTAMRGGAMPTTKVGRQLDLDLDTRDLASSGPYKVQLVDATGKEVWAATETVQGGHVHARLDARLSAGQYYVRAIDSRGAQREYSLRLSK